MAKLYRDGDAATAVAESSPSKPPDTPATASTQAANPVPRLDPEHGAALLRDGALAVYLSSGIDQSIAAPLPIASFQLYRDTLLKDLDTRHPLAVMMAEQLAVAHHIHLRLQVRVAHAKSADEIQIIGGAACQLMAEFRRTATVLLDVQHGAFRVVETPTAPTGSGDNRQADLTLPEADASNQTTAPRTELGSNGGNHGGRTAIVPFEESPPRRRRKAKSA